MFKFIFLLYLLLCSLPFQLSIKIDDYCKPDPNNTPCKTKCARDAACGNTGTNFTLLTAAQRELVAKRHNEYRQKTAAGDYAAHHLPACEGCINAISYDKECEFLVSCHLKSCIWGHDDQRITHAGERTGQNMFSATYDTPQKTDEALLTKAIDAWFLEANGMQSEAVIHAYDGSAGRGHVAQLLWGDTKYVGCGMMHLMDGKKHKYHVGCNYKSAGNIQGAAVYQKLKEECTPNTDYAHLCGTIRPLAEDKFSPPLNLNGATTIAVSSIYSYFLIITLGHIVLSFIMHKYIVGNQ